MQTKEFIPFVESLENNELNLSDSRIIHAILGITSEAGEVAGLVKKSVVYHVPLNIAELKEETGDLLHYIAMLLSAQGWTFEEIFEINAAKLRKRYPNGFNREDALLRKDKLVSGEYR